MTEPISRRDFLKVAGLGAAASAVLTGCGTAARYVQRQPYAEMPEYTHTGQSVYFATTCGECPAGCGLIVRTMEGRAHKVEGNPAHPVNAGRTCARGQASLQGLYNPDRLQAPGRQASPGSGRFDPISWDAATGVVKDALQSGAVFLLGSSPDHLHDLTQVLAGAMDEASVLAFSALGEFDGRVTLMDAAQKLFGSPGLPIFDIARAEVTFSFGANFTETWLSPVAYARAYGDMRQGHPGQRGYLVQFEPRMSQTAANADEWIPIAPGSEGLAARALARLISEEAGGAAFPDVDITAAAAASGISEDELLRLARIFAGAPRKVAIPGGGALGHTHGLSAAESILALNAVAGVLGQEGGLFLTPASPIHPGRVHRPSTLAEMGALIDRMKAGQVQSLFIHRSNPVYELPAALGFAEALRKVPRVISFSPVLDETTMQAHYALPDHTPLESWGYQNAVAGGDRLAISAFQPVVAPLYDTRATADVLLAAAQAAGGALAQAAVFTDEVDFVQQSSSVLIGQGGIPATGGAQAQAIFWARWQQTGGWWSAAPGLDVPSIQPGSPAAPLGNPAFSGDPAEFNLHLLLFPHPNLADGAVANYPWLQETPDPMTTVMWNSWVEIHPETARALGVQSDDVVRVVSPAGQVEAVVYEYPAIRPDVIAMPLGQGHTALGRYARGRGANPLDLLAPLQNESGGLAFMATRVKVQPAGRKFKLARYESQRGVYGQGGQHAGE